MNSDPQQEAQGQFDAHDESGGARQSLWRELGLNEPEYLDESLAPQVDEMLLRRLVRQELPEKAARAVYRLIYSFASWHQAHGKVLLDEIQNGRQGAGP